MSGYRKLGWAAVVAAGGALLGGCTSSPASSAPPPPTSVSATATVVIPTSLTPAPASTKPTAHATAAATPTTTATGGGGVAGCASADLRADPGTTGAATGSVFQEIVFTNLGSAPCTLFGYPGVSLAAGTPVTQVGAAADRSAASTPALVTLAPGGKASALLRITQAENYSQDKCQQTPTTYLQIYPPNQTTPLYMPYKSTGCALDSVHLLIIEVVQPGTGS